MARKSKKRSKSENAKPETAPVQTRREFVRRIALYGLGAAVLGGGGTALALDMRRKLAEADLNRIGNGLPSVVQIHDPNCGLCATLQKAARRAFAECDETKAIAQYLVANVRSEDGAQFQRDMALPHVTLVFFDGSGRHVHTIQGVTPTDDIKDAISSQFG